MSRVSLYREIDALGGTANTEWGGGYGQALDDVLAILSRRGYSENCDPTLDALVALDAAGRTAWHFRQQDTNAMLGFAAALSKARLQIIKARDEA